MVMLPLFGDQGDNVQRLVSRGAAETLSIYDLTAEKLLVALRKVINDKSYKEKSKLVVSKNELAESFVDTALEGNLCLPSSGPTLLLHLTQISIHSNSIPRVERVEPTCGALDELVPTLQQENFPLNIFLETPPDASLLEGGNKTPALCRGVLQREASLDSSSPDFVPSLFVYTKQSQTPKTKMERYHRKRRRDERPDMQPASSMAEMEQDCTIDHCSDEEEAEGDRPVSRKEYDDLCFRHQLQEDYINLQQDCYKLRSENEELRRPHHYATGTYTEVLMVFDHKGLSCSFFHGLTPEKRWDV
ncbi:hypothetical protein G5714_010554 [Onychostoma macrolepis]|uniref:Glucuronosyltransferase n=1 Tax=Onychostoma macrolepis TaxID=369639 RepID=A0A7J6CQU5_9TELE|nr:hypothetical protein G5714_010554 [Onychostoma macrolepis]